MAIRLKALFLLTNIITVMSFLLFISIYSRGSDDLHSLTSSLYETREELMVDKHDRNASHSEATLRHAQEETTLFISQILLGDELSDMRRRLYHKTKLLKFLEEYKNPCWIEKLPQNISAEYRNSAFYRFFNQSYVMLDIFKERLKGKSPWRLRCLPYFYLAGVTKSGTSDFYDAILNHPDVMGGWVKEPMYWNRQRYPKNVTIQKDRMVGHMPFYEYVNEFDFAAHLINESTTPLGNLERTKIQKIIVDGSSYTFWEDNGWEQHPGNKGLKEPKYTTPMALHAVQPDAKIILMFRNPTKRLYSAFGMHTGMAGNSNKWRPLNRFKRPAESPHIASHFDHMIRTTIQKYNQCFVDHGWRPCAYNVSLSRDVFPVSLVSSMYAVFLQDWLDVFPRNQIMIVQSEQYYQHRMKTFRDVFKFIGLSQVDNNIATVIQEQEPSFKQFYRPMFNSTKKLLDDFFEPFNSKLEAILHRTFWR